ncbi:thiosulfate oxidation carrier complex protein SoxZ [Rhizobium sp. EC-SD404]|uniref:thiosulfate oxidation carrier complex protein SoxZ n=1 Tax=Rhizobium sp. EC-SD404 TaxID=2038389 RepID=UPI0012574BB6|nr:thiosulfate oxidation carrier complex protein SoxZ [Rhizobium sp. EC-SD404]VVT08953.1 Sulfur oxidation protein SoxZ [Rhizobium sp. EC-SD404]
MSSRPRVSVPATAASGDIIEIKALISHTMESGQRRDASGNRIPRKIINQFACSFNDEPVFSCAIEPAVAANPFLSFSARVTESGTFRFTWTDDDGSVYEAEEAIEVS